MPVSLVLNEASVSEASLASAPRAGSVRELLFQLVHPSTFCALHSPMMVLKERRGREEIYHSVMSLF